MLTFLLRESRFDCEFFFAMCEETWPFLSFFERDARKARGTHSEERNHEGAWFLYILLYFNQGPLLTPFPRKHGQENERLMGGKVQKRVTTVKGCGFWSRANLPFHGRCSPEADETPSKVN